MSAGSRKVFGDSYSIRLLINVKNSIYVGICAELGAK